MLKLDINKLKEALVEPGHITEEDFEKALQYAKTKKKNIEDVIVEWGLMDEDNLNRLIADLLDFEFVDLSNEEIDDDVFHLIPQNIAEDKKVIAFARNQDGVMVGMRDPSDLVTRHFLEKKLGQNIIPFLISESDYHEALSRYSGDILTQVKQIIESFNTSKDEEERDKLVIDLVNKILVFGAENKASDIHLEPYEKKVVARYRIDGVMHDILEIPINIYLLVLSRIKILSKMRTDEHQAAQDGKLKFKLKDERIDVRVSVAPITKGEKVVMRLLSASSRNYTLTDLGLSDKDLKKVKDAISHPHGMVLATGPTGSGKTTTLYALLKLLNKPEVNITTIEDPVEYDIEGVNQIQVNERTGLTFSKGLRSIVRQDPDIIMVGEIRDKDTANIAVNAALTGHLLLSTLHTNNAATTFPRLLDMSVEPFLVASTVNVVIAQRLVRKICLNCRVSLKLSSKEKKTIVEQLGKLIKNKKLLSQTTYVYKGNGCSVCNYTGFKGRVGIFEVLLVSDGIKNLIINNATSDQIQDLAVKEGMVTMLEDGLNKISQGITTIEEVLRVTRD